MHPEAADGEAELRLVADAEADGARRPVGELDIERQFAVGVERLRRPDAHRVEHAERSEPAAQLIDLGGIVELAFLERHAALQVGRVDLLRAREAHCSHPGDGACVDGESDLGLARGVVDHDFAFHHRQGVALLAELGECAVLGGQDGSGVGRIAGGEAELAHVDRRQGLGARTADGDAADLEARAGVDGEREGQLFGVGMRVDGVEGGGLVDRTGCRSWRWPWRRRSRVSAARH